MEQLYKILKSRIFWSIVITTVFVNQVVNANKETHKELLNEYYGSVSQAVTADSLKKEAQASNGSITTKADSITNYALTLLGKGYVYGKVGPENFDCSGLIYHVFKKFNVSLPHSSRAQAKLGEKLEKEEIRVGDLLFFKSPSPNNPNIGHVGIAIENKNGLIKFIHSSTGRGVVINDLNSKHYGKRFMEARRVLN